MPPIVIYDDTLTPEERARIYRIQCDLGAVKRCATCGQTKCVDQFANYGRRSCWDCSTPASERCIGSAA